ncbi:MAG: cytochrome c [Alphaproteobacteria bacterium]|nr:cytochrome c [Alphaproteobacteria bacterium]
MMKWSALFAAAVCGPLLAGCMDDLSAGSVAGPRLSDEQTAQIEDGRAIAEGNCAACHAIGSQGDSPNPLAPRFRLLLSRYKADVLETELNEGMRVAHAPMPQFQFKPEATASLIAYLRSVQTRDPGLALVEQRCSRCHAIGATDTSPYPGAQPFRKLGQRWWRGQLRDALKTGIIVEHDTAEARVPPMKLNDAEIDALLAYLDSIATKENPAPKAP